MKIKLKPLLKYFVSFHFCIRFVFANLILLTIFGFFGMACGHKAVYMQNQLDVRRGNETVEEAVLTKLGTAQGPVQLLYKTEIVEEGDNGDVEETTYEVMDVYAVLYMPQHREFAKQNMQHMTFDVDDESLLVVDKIEAGLDLWYWSQFQRGLTTHVFSTNKEALLREVPWIEPYESTLQLTPQEVAEVNRLESRSSFLFGVGKVFLIFTIVGIFLALAGLMTTDGKLPSEDYVIK